MAVSSTTIQHRYKPGAAMAQEALAGLVFDTGAALSVVRESDHAELVEGVHYQIGGDSLAGAGWIRALIVEGVNTWWRVRRETPISQPRVFGPFEPFSRAEVEAGLDRLTLIAQETAAAAYAGVRAPVGETLSELPDAATRAGKYVMFGPDGDSSLDTPENFAAPAAQAAAAAEEAAEQAQAVMALIPAAGAAQVAAVNAAGADKVAAVQAQGNASVAAVVTQEAASIANVNAAGAVQTANAAVQAGMAQAGALAAAAATGTVRKALILDVDPSFLIGQSRTIFNDQGRFRRNANGWYRATTANEERTYYDNNGTLQGVLIEAGESYLSAGWDTATAPTSGQDAFLTKSVAADSIIYATGHALADIFGSTGKCVKLVEGATPNGQIYPGNLTAALVAGDIFRVEAHISIADAKGTAGSFQIGTRVISGSVPGAYVLVSFDATGALTSVSGVSVRRFDYYLFETLADGTKVYFFWFEAIATATGVMAPSIRMPNPAINGFAVGMHDLRALKNPVSRLVSAVPVLNRVTFNADKIVLPTTQPFAVEFHRMRRGATLQTGGAVTLPTGQIAGNAKTGYRSGPYGTSISAYIPLERRISVSPTAEAVNKDYILPNNKQVLDLQPAGLGEDVTVYLGPNYHYEFTGFTNVTTGTLTIQGAYPSPDKWPTAAPFTTSQTYLANFVTRNMAWFARASTKSEEIGQTGITQSCVFGASASIVRDRTLFTSHTQWHTRGDGTCFLGEEAGASQVRYMDYFALLPRPLSGNGPTALTVTNNIDWRIGRGNTQGALAPTQVVNMVTSRNHREEIYSDAVYWGSGTLNVTRSYDFHGKFTDWQYDWYQSRDKIMVDIGDGAGPQPLPYGGWDGTNLPRNRVFSLHTCRPGPGKPMDATAATIMKWATPARASRAFMWDLLPTESTYTSRWITPGQNARFEPLNLRGGGAFFLGNVGPVYSSYNADLLAVTDWQDGDWAYVTKWTDAGTHVDPILGAGTPNWGAFRALAGYGWCWCAHAWPEQGGAIYATKVALAAAWAPALPALPPVIGTCAEVYGDGANDGIYYCADNAGTPAYLGPLTLPVYASLNGKPSPTNPAIYVTIDHTYCRNTDGAWIGVSGGNPGYLGQGATHADNNQINASGVNLSLTQYGCIYINHAMGDNLPGQVNSTLPLLDVHHNIYINDTYNQLLLQNTSPTDSMTWHDNLVLPYQARFLQGAAVPYPWIAGTTMRTAVVTYNNWFASDDGKTRASLDAASTGSFSQTPNLIARQTMANYKYAPSKRTAGVIRVEDVIDTSKVPLAIGGTIPESVRLQDLVFTSLAEQVTGLDLNTTVKTVLGILGFTPEVATLKALIHPEQLKPDYLAVITENHAVGTVLFTGLKGRLWDPKRGGHEDQLFTLVNGTVTINQALTGQNFRRLYITDMGERVEIDCRFVLGNLALSNVAPTHGVAWSATVTGFKTYSYGQGGLTQYATVTATSSDGTPLTVSGSSAKTISGTFPNAGTFNITLTENVPTPIAAQTEVVSNPGKTTVIAVTVA